MQTGRMRELVTIQSATETQDSYGEPIKTWANLASNPTVWASVLPAASGERFIPGGEVLQSNLTHTVRMRFRTVVTVKMRLLWETRFLEIENALDPTGKRAEMILMCREVQA